jgi:hypothetical protein
MVTLTCLTALAHLLEPIMVVHHSQRLTVVTMVQHLSHMVEHLTNRQFRCRVNL